ncbi:hypothetical protein CANCADRAFT_88984 [Tortispora caseinolytica NRRL Y-17796]|uniref:PCI domain-containing protein n=1 Tax=Tortispora caseinolytica NRRL Y-17796 TaxID=767744 RepID=A0A1E4TLF9_9ASCO|nr:hypothetical protein CANCADRAFT_88984 [Tortispora caseinolytica NRRL Y-17796]
MDVQEKLAELREKAPEELQGGLYAIEDLWDRKLWHQLTDALLELSNIRESEPFRMDIFETVVLAFKDKINQLKLIELGIKATSVLKPEDAVVFMKQLTDGALTEEATVFGEIEQARLQLQIGNLKDAKKALDEASKILDHFNSVEPRIYAAYYKASAKYHEAKAEFSSYYRTTLLYLSCIQLEDLSADELYKEAYDISIAALLGDIYNFGELILHPILNALDGTETEWLKSLLVAINIGDLAKFTDMTSKLNNVPILKNSLPFLQQKICLAALVETAFSRPPADRILDFELIAQSCQIPVDQVEHLIMKALSIKLIEGSIDQVSQTVTISWIQPRILNIEQIGAMRDRLVSWDKTVSNVTAWVDSLGADLWAQQV